MNSTWLIMGTSQTAECSECGNELTVSPTSTECHYVVRPCTKCIDTEGKYKNQYVVDLLEKFISFIKREA